MSKTKMTEHVRKVAVFSGLLVLAILTAGCNASGFLAGMGGFGRMMMGWMWP